MPIYRPALDAFTLDGVLTLDLERGVATIDLARIGFVNAYALTALACFIASTAGDGLAVVLILPEEIDVRSWLSRMHLGDVLDTFEVRVEGVLPRVAERDRKDTLIELERFEDSRGSDRLASFIWERLEGGADGEVVNQLFEATGELGLNVVEHAGSPIGGFVAAQRYKAGSPEERIIVAVGDVGIGIRESLRPRYGAMPDGEAIRRAVQMERLPRPGRGPGTGASGGRRRGPGARRDPVDPERDGVEDHDPQPDEDPRRVRPARYDCWCPVALPARQVTWGTEARPTMSTLIAPKLVSSRHQARELTAGLADDLSGTIVMVDCSALQASTPSFVDELVKSVLVDRQASRLRIKGAPERTVELARRAAQNRGVVDRLETG
jgi:hypothetical protein